MANINNAVVSEKSRSVLASVARGSGTPVYVEIYRKMLQLIKEGDGDAMIDVDDNCGGSYPLSKFNIPNGTPPLKATVGKLGKWISLGY